MKTAIIGGKGYVGKAYNKIFTDAVINDVDTDNFDEVNKCDLAIVCVPTPTANDGFSCDTSIVESVIRKLETKYILIKSTVAIGTTHSLSKKYNKRIVFSPEFVGEGGYFIQYWKYPHKNDPSYHDFQILGGEQDATRAIAKEFLRRVGPHLKVYQTDSTTAEVIKYTENMFIATKVTFVNEMAEVCKVVGVDWTDVREGWLLDSRVSPMFSAVFEDKRGYEGKCLPKDTKALIQASKDKGYFPVFLDAVIKNNNRIRILNNFDPV